MPSPRASGRPELDAAVDVTVLCNAPVAREVAGEAFGDGGSGPRNAAKKMRLPLARGWLHELSGRPHLPLMFLSIDVFTDQGQISVVDMRQK